MQNKSEKIVGKNQQTYQFWESFGMGFGSLRDTTWGMEKAGFGEARLTGTRQQPLRFEAQLGVPFWIPRSS